MKLKESNKSNKVALNVKLRNFETLVRSDFVIVDAESDRFSDRAESETVKEETK